MDYSLITEQQVQKRYNSLSDKIRSVLDSENNVIVVGQIYRQHHLDDERILLINQLISLVLLGFVSADDFRQEIMDNLHLNYQHSNDIAKEIHEKIFTPIRSEIDKMFILSRPSEIESELEVSQTSAPVISDIVKPEIKITKPKPAVVEPLKIITTEEGEKIILPGMEAPESPKIDESLKVPESQSLKGNESPVVLHKEEAVKPVFGNKKSLGDLFGHLLGKKSPVLPEKEEKEAVSIAGQVDIGADKDESLKLEEPARVVHYENILRTPISETGEPVPILSENFISQPKEILSAAEEAMEEKKKEEKLVEKLMESSGEQSSTAGGENIGGEKEKIAEPLISKEELAKAKVVDFKMIDDNQQPTTDNLQPTTDDQQLITQNFLKLKSLKGFFGKLFKFRRQPITDNLQPTTYNQQPIIDNQQPTTDNQQLTIDNLQQTIENKKQGFFSKLFKKQIKITNNLQPTTDNKQLVTDNQQPITDNQQPTTDNLQSTTNNRQPTTDNQQ